MTLRPSAAPLTATRAVTIACLVVAAGACTSSSGDDAAADETAVASQPDPAATSTTTAVTTSASTTTTHATNATPASTASAPDTEPTSPAATVDQATTNTADCTSVGPGRHTFTLDAGGAVHDVQVYVPTSSNDTQALPLVLNWHGLGSNGEQQALFTGYEELAESEGFVVAHPTGVPLAGDTRNSWEFGLFEDPGRDDVAFADELIDHLIAGYCVDGSRVYSTGMSNGGLFTSFLVCELADRLAAAASVAGISHHDECSPSRAVPFIAMHGTADGVVPYDGTSTTSSLEGNAPSTFFDQVMPDEFAEYAADMGCDPEPEIAQLSPDVIAHSYLGCDGGAPLIFYEITDGGHTWPNTPIIDLLPPGLGYTTTEIDATVDAWRFFEQHMLQP